MNKVLGASILRSKLSVLLVVVLLASAMVAVVALTQDEIQVVVQSWLAGKPKMLVELELKLPLVDADYCFIAVKRFSTPSNPTKNGVVEDVHIGLHKPGSSVVVKKLLDAFVAKWERDPATGELKVGYHEPQELFIIAHCVKGNSIVLKYGRIHKAYLKSPIHREAIEIPVIPEKARLAHDISGSSGSTSLTCVINITGKTPTGGNIGECYAFIAGPYIYSLRNLYTSLGLLARPKPSVVYVEGFWDTVYCPLGYCERDAPIWSSAGKKLVVSDIDDSTPELMGNYKVRVFFRVKYVYEENWWCDSFAGVCFKYYLLYPQAIKGLFRGDEIGLASLEPYTPPRHPGYAALLGYGVTEINFININFHEDTHKADEVSANTLVVFKLPPYWSATLSVGFYKAGRNDRQYTTPYLRVSNTRSELIYWWYKDNDPTTYEVMFSDT